MRESRPPATPKRIPRLSSQFESYARDMKQVWILGFLAILVQACAWHVGIAKVSDPYEFGQPDDPYLEGYAESRHAIVLTPALGNPPYRGRAGEVRNAPSLDDYGIDWGFIAELEGESRTEGYVPTERGTGKVLGHSGVTVGTGFDLGQHGEADLRRMGISEELITKLHPYLQLQVKNAQNFLKKNPLNLRPEQLAELSDVRAESTSSSETTDAEFRALIESLEKKALAWPAEYVQWSEPVPLEPES